MKLVQLIKELQQMQQFLEAKGFDINKVEVLYNNGGFARPVRNIEPVESIRPHRNSAETISVVIE